jgi:hypothetical protein
VPAKLANDPDSRCAVVHTPFSARRRLPCPRLEQRALPPPVPVPRFSDGISAKAADELDHRIGVRQPALRPLIDDLQASLRIGLENAVKLLQRQSLWHVNASEPGDRSSRDGAILS